MAPAASAAAFLATPASSTPTGSFESSQTTPARVKIPASPSASASSKAAATSPAPACDHLLGVRGTADAGDAVRAEARAQQRRRRRAVGRDEALRERDDRGAAAEPPTPEAVDRARAAPSRGPPGRRSRRARRRSRRGSIRSGAGSSTPGRYVLVDARARRATRPAPRCASAASCGPPRATSRTATAVPNEPAPITIARRAPGSDACARLSMAGRAVRRSRSPDDLRAHAREPSGRGSDHADERRAPRPRSPPRRRPRESPADRGFWRRSGRSRSCRRSRARARPIWRARVAISAAILPCRLVASSRPSPTITARLASSRRSKSIASSTNGAPGDQLGAQTRPQPAREPAGGAGHRHAARQPEAPRAAPRDARPPPRRRPSAGRTSPPRARTACARRTAR